MDTALHYSIEKTKDAGEMERRWAALLDVGATILPLGPHSYMAGHPESDAYFQAALVARYHLGDLPFQMQLEPLYHRQWGGEWDGPTVYRRNDDTMFDDDHLDVYHTNVRDAARDHAGGLKGLLLDVFGPNMNNAQAVRYLHCPGYRGPKYQNSLAKLDKTSEVYQPEGVLFDNEIFTSPRRANAEVAKALRLPRRGFEALGGCERCGGGLGYATNVDAIGRDLARCVTRHVPEAVIGQYNVYRHAPDVDRMDSWGWDFDAGLMNTPVPYLYAVTHQRQADGTTRFFTDMVARFQQLEEKYASVPSPFWSGGLKGACVTLSQRMDPHDPSAGFVESDAMADLCRYLMRLGAKRFSLWPGYKGTGGDEDEAALRLLKVMYAAFEAPLN